VQALPAAGHAIAWKPFDMMPLDRDIDRAHALVIDGNPTSRSIIASQLRELGVGNVTQASRLADGRRRLEAKRYDIVVCEQQFPGDNQSGQELLDDLRRAQLLPYATVFIMITGEARYEHVAEAAESALDSYLLKPYSAATLAERLRQARHRKRSLGQIFAAIEADDFEQAAALCQARFEQRGDYWLYAARIGAELLLRVGRHAEAQQLYGAIIEAKAVPWAKLGVARAQADAGQVSSARRTLESLISADPAYADAYDVMGRVQIEQGQFDEALATYRMAATMTPGSIARLQKQGMLAF
jgi:CheY-like chemotaxis protein